jgi:hypothetical protein
VAGFDYSLDFENTDFREEPHLYRVGKGEQGVLVAEPYKSEILPHWRFRTEEVARESSAKIYEMFLGYKEEDDFVGMDMARKFLQMGWTRSLRYGKRKSGRKQKNGETLPLEIDPEKMRCAAIFKRYYDLARLDPEYIEMKKKHKEIEREEERR